MFWNSLAIPKPYSVFVFFKFPPETDIFFCFVELYRMYFTLKVEEKKH